MGIFPAAIYLYENAFDIRSLLQETGWSQGGPNVHPLSLFTWFVAGVLALTDSAPATFAITRITTFGLLAWSLVLFSRVLIAYGLTPRIAIAAGCFLVLMPLVLVQIGYLYTETWVMAFGIAAWAACQEGRANRAVLFCALGLFTKLTAMAIALCVGMVLLLRLRPITPGKILRLGALLLAPLVVYQLKSWLGSTAQPVYHWGDPIALLDRLVYGLSMIPDVTFLLAAGMIYAALYMSKFLFRERGLAALLNGEPDAGGRFISLAMPFVFLAGIVAMTFGDMLFLPRYLLPVIPFILVPILLRIDQLFSGPAVFGILVAVCAVSIVNFGGRLYPDDLGRFSIVERSHAYQEFHQLQIDAIDSLQEIPDRLPVFVSREIYYMVSSPLMGYVEREMPQVKPIFTAPFRDQPLESFPDEFVLLYTNRGHGGEQIERLVEESRRTLDTEVEARNIVNGDFRGAIFRFRKIRPPTTAT